MSCLAGNESSVSGAVTDRGEQTESDRMSLLTHDVTLRYEKKISMSTSSEVSPRSLAGAKKVLWRPAELP